MKKILNKPLRILLFTNGLILVAGATLAPIYALFVAEIGGDLLDASYAIAAFAFAAGVTVLLSGRLSDKAKENEYIVVIGYVVMGIGFLSYIWVSSMVTLLISQIIIGFGEAFYAPAFDALYSKHLPKNKRGVSWGTWEAMNYFVMAIGAVVGGFIVTTQGFEPLFVMMAILAFVSAAYILFVPRKVL